MKNLNDVGPEVEGVVSAEKFINLQTAIGEYSEEKISKISKGILEKFESGEFKLDEPEGLTHPGVAYRNLIYALADNFSTARTPEADDELNYTLFGVAFKKAMDANPEFDKFIRDYIKKAQESDREAWSVREELYQRYLDSDRDGHPRKYLLDPEDDRYHQGSTLAKFILREM